MNLPLQQLRTRAKLSHDELAIRLGISQDQLIRWEYEPSTMPFQLVHGWCQACGSSFEELLRLCAIASNVGIDAGRPYADLHAKLDVLQQYVSSAPQLSPDIPPPTITPEAFSRRITSWRQKPTVLITGRFDSGKTRIANALLGSENLPSQYTPTTSIVTFVRHVAERPEWQKEDVLVMRKGFEFARWRDQAHCESFKITAGDFEILKQYGVKESEGEKQGAKAALVYIDAPLLHACTLVDVPGFQDDESDAELATNSQTLADIVLYTSPAKGFLDQGDFLHLGQILRNLEPLNPSAGPASFANFFLVATHADPSISDRQLQHIVNRGAERLYKHFSNTLFAPGAASARRLSQAQVRELIATFWFEEPSRRKRLEEGLRHTLAELMPNSIQLRIDTQVKRIKTKALSDLRDGLKAYESALAELEAARAELERQRKNLPQHQAEIARDRLAFRKEIDCRRESTKRFIKAEIEPMVSSQAIEKFIRANFDQSRDDAKRDAVPRLLENVQDTLEKHLKAESETLAPSLLKYSHKYRLMAGVMNVPELDEFEGIDFDSETQNGWRKRIFALGNKVPSLAGLVSIAAGLASMLVVGLFSFFGVDWRPRLAKKISETLQAKGLLSKMRERVEVFWDTNWTTFESGADALEARFLEYMARNEELLKGNSEEKIKSAIVTLKDLQHHFENLPWDA